MTFGVCMALALLHSGAVAAAASARTPQAPLDAPPELKRLVGEYGAPDSLLTIYESDGQLFADGNGLTRVALRRLSPIEYEAGKGLHRSVHLKFDADGLREIVDVDVGDKRLPRLDIGRDTVEHFRSSVRADAGALRAKALAATPPVEPAPKRATDLVDLASLGSSIRFDIRYATSNNFMGFPLYETPAAFLQRPAAQALRRAAQSLAPRGYGLLVHDAYRPWFVTKMFWDATPAAAHIFVADPAEGSRHNRGCAVDLTLYELASGKPVEMTGSYDEMSPRSFAEFPGGTSRQRFLRDLLRTAMEAQGFAVYAEEWWHFDYQDWHDYAIGNVTFEHLRARETIPNAQAALAVRGAPSQDRDHPGTAAR